MKKPIFKSRKFRVALALTVALTCFISQLVPAFAGDELLGIPKTDEVKIETPVEGNIPADGIVPPTEGTPVAPPTGETPVAPPEGGIVGEPTAPVAPPTEGTPSVPGGVVIPPVEGPNGAETPTVPNPDGEFIGPVGPVGPVGPHTPGAGTRDYPSLSIPSIAGTYKIAWSTDHFTIQKDAEAATPIAPFTSGMKPALVGGGTGVNVTIDNTVTATTLVIAALRCDTFTNNTSGNISVVNTSATTASITAVTGTTGGIVLDGNNAITYNGYTVASGSSDPTKAVLISKDKKAVVQDTEKIIINNATYTAVGVESHIDLATPAAPKIEASGVFNIAGSPAKVTLAQNAAIAIGDATNHYICTATDAAAVLNLSGVNPKITSGKITVTKKGTPTGNVTFALAATASLVVGSTTKTATGDESWTVSPALAFAAGTTGSTVLYVNGNTGDDAKDGTTVATAKKDILTAIGALTTGGEIRLLSDLALPSAIGATLTNDTDKLSIVGYKADGSVKETRTITRGGTGNFALFNIVKGEVTLENIKITDAGTTHNNAPVVLGNASNSAKLTLGNAATIENTSSNFSAIYVFNGTVIMNAGSAIKGNTNNAASYSVPAGDNDPINGGGGAITLGTKTLTGNLIINGGEISGNKAHTGGGVYASNNSTITMTSGKINGNEATGRYGGGVALAGTSSFTMSGGELSSNKANNESGGAISSFVGSSECASTINISGGTITGNETKFNGSVIHGGSGTIEIGGNVNIRNNKVTGTGYTGSAIYPHHSTSFKMSGAPVITGNTNRDNSAMNIYLPTGQTIKLTAALTGSANIGVTAVADATIAKGSKAANEYTLQAGDAQFFHDDSGKNVVAFAADVATGGILKLAPSATKKDVYVNAFYMNGAGGAISNSDQYDITSNDGSKDKPYFSIERAYKDVENGGTIHLLSNIDVDNIVTGFSLEKTCKIGSYDAATGLVPLTGDSRWTIKNATTDRATHMFEITAGTVTLENVIVDGGAIWSGGAIDPTLNRNTTNSGKKATEEMIYVKGGNLVLNSGATLQNNDNVNSDSSKPGASHGDNATGDTGSAVWINGGSLTMETGSAIKDNAITKSIIGDGAAVSVWGGGTFTMNGGIISGNNAARHGTVRVIDGKATIGGNSKIINNKANKATTATYASSVGGIFTNANQLTLKGTPTIKNNTADPRASSTSGGDVQVPANITTTNLDATGLNASPRSIGISGTVNTAFTTASDTLKAKENMFFADDATLTVKYDATSKKLQLVAAAPYVVYVANSDTGEGCTTAGNDTTGNGTIAKPYLTIAKAYGEVNDDNGIIYVMDTISVPKTNAVNFNSDKNITITSCKADGTVDSTINTIKNTEANTDTSMFTFTKGTVNFENINVDGGAIWSSSNDANLDRSTVNTGITVKTQMVLVNGGTLNLLDGATIQNCDNIVNGPGSADKGGAMQLNAGKVNMQTGAKIINNAANGDVADGGAVAIWGGVFTMNGGEMKGNFASRLGGAVRVQANDGFVMNGGSIHNNKVSQSNASANGGGICPTNGADFIMSGNPTVKDNFKGNSGIASTVKNNVYLEPVSLIKLKGLTAGAQIGVTTQNPPTDARDIKIVIDAKSGEKQYFEADNKGVAGIKQTGSDLFLSASERYPVFITHTDDTITAYKTFDEAMGDLVSGDKKITLTADCTTNTTWQSFAAAYTIEGNNHTIAITGLAPTTDAANQLVTIQNLKITAPTSPANDPYLDYLQVKTPVKFVNCTLPNVYVGRAAEFDNTTINGHLRTTSTTDLKLDTSDVKCTGEIRLTDGSSVIKLATNSDDTNSYNVTYADAIPLSENKVVFDGDATGGAAIAEATLTALAKKVTINDGTEWVAIKGSTTTANKIILKTPKAYFVSNVGNDSTGSGTALAPYKTIAKAYEVANGASERNISINLLTDLPSNVANAVSFNATDKPNIDSVIIQSANDTDNDGKPTLTADVRTITRKDADTPIFTANGISITLNNVTLDGAKATIASKTSLVTLANGATLSMGNKATIQNNSSTAHGAGVSLTGDTSVLTMNTGSKICGNSTTKFGGGIALSDKSTFIMHGGEISGNSAATAGQSGGAITMHVVNAQNSNVLIDGGSITGNVAACNGSAIHGGTATGTITISNTAQIKTNSCSTSGYNGAAVYPYNSPLSLSGSIDITENRYGIDSRNVGLTKDKTLAINGVLTGTVGIYTDVAPNVDSEVKFATNAKSSDADCFTSDRKDRTFVRCEEKDAEDANSLYLDVTPIPTLPPITGGGNGNGGGNGGGGNGGTDVKEVTAEIPEGGDKNNWPDGNSPKLEVSDEDYSSSLRLIVSPLKATTKQGKNFAKISCYRFLGMHSVDLLDGTQKIYKTNGKAKVFLPFKGKDDVSYTVFRQNENGTITMIGATYKDGYLSFETNEFCNTYAISIFDEKAIVIDKPNKPTTNPATGVALLGKLF